MKVMSLLIAAVISCSYAGYGYHYVENDIQIDTKGNQLYIGINGSKVEGTFNKTEKIGSEIIDYLIYNPTTKSKKRLIPQNKKTITSFTFEKGYSDSLQQIIFNRNDDYSSVSIINNRNIEKRAPYDKLLYVIENEEREVKEFWQCTKAGGDKEKIYTLSTKNKYSWHIDVFNRVIRFIIKLPNDIEIIEVEW